MLYNEPHPLEVKVLTRLFGLENSQSLDTYLAHEGFAGFRKALEMAFLVGHQEEMAKNAG